MPRRVATGDDWEDDEPEEDDYSTGDDLEYVEDEGDDDPTAPCPHCGKAIFDEAEQCPHCGQYISTEDSPPSPRSWWVILGALVCLGLVLMWILS